MMTETPNVGTFSHCFFLSNHDHGLSTSRISTQELKAGGIWRRKRPILAASRRFVTGSTIAVVSLMNLLPRYVREENEAEERQPKKRHVCEGGE